MFCLLVSIPDQALLIKQTLQEFRDRLKIPQTVLDQCDANPCPSHVRIRRNFNELAKPNTAEGTLDPRFLRRAELCRFGGE